MKPRSSAKRSGNDLEESLDKISQSVSEMSDKRLKTAIEYHIESVKLKRLKVEALEVVVQPRNALAEVEVAIAKCDYYAELASLKSFTIKLMLERERDEAKYREQKKVFIDKACQTSPRGAKRKMSAEKGQAESKRRKISHTTGDTKTVPQKNNHTKDNNNNSHNHSKDVVEKSSSRSTEKGYNFKLNASSKYVTSHQYTKKDSQSKCKIPPTVHSKASQKNFNPGHNSSSTVNGRACVDTSRKENNKNVMNITTECVSCRHQLPLVVSQPKNMYRNTPNPEPYELIYGSNAQNSGRHQLVSSAGTSQHPQIKVEPRDVNQLFREMLLSRPISPLNSSMHSTATTVKLEELLES